MQVALLHGGLSSEAPISHKSADAIRASLIRLGHNVIDIDAKRDVATQLQAQKIDIAFNALHGTYGEDGCVQGVLEYLAIPYTHSGVRASAVAMHKPTSKTIYRANNIGTPADYNIADINSAPLPFVLKKCNEGSSVEVYIINDYKQLDEINNLDGFMAEQYIAGRELSVSVLDDEALGVIEIEMTGWYDFTNKYQSQGKTKYHMPANINADIYREAEKMAISAHHSLGCHSVSRSDFRLSPSGELYMLETNTHPGMTESSLLPKMAAHSGIGFDELVTKILQGARLENVK